MKNIVLHKKRTLLLVLVALLICCFVATVAIEYHQQIVSAAQLSNGEQKVYSEIGEDAEFSDKTILVTLTNKVSLSAKRYTVKDFAEISCVEVVDMTDGIWDTVRSHRHTVKCNPETEIKSETFNRILKITISDEGRDNVIAAIRKLEKRNDVKIAEPDYISTLADIPDDTYYAEQWGNAMINLPNAWNVEKGTAKVLVGVIDTGIDNTHPDLVNRVNTTLSRDFSEETDDPFVDYVTHGTHVAGIIGAEPNNGTGVAGVCWNVNLVALKISNARSINSSCTVQAVLYATKSEIPIINMSLGGNATNASLREALQNYPGLALCAAGNSSEDNDVKPHYPSSYEVGNILAVGASNSADGVASISNYGATSVDVFAPGDTIYSTVPSGYGNKTGTSMATPYVTGLAALLLSHDSTLSAAKIKEIIMNSVDKVDAFVGRCVTGGRINAYKALVSLHDHSWATVGNQHVNLCSSCELTGNLHDASWVCEKYTDGQHVRYCTGADGFCPFVEVEDHPWEITWSWSMSDESASADQLDYVVATANMYCDVCDASCAANVIATLTGSALPDCTNAGYADFAVTLPGRYSSSAVNETKHFVLPALGHDCDETWTWYPDSESASVTETQTISASVSLTCNRGCGLSTTQTAVVQDVTIVVASCAEGSRSVTATVEYDNQLFSANRTYYLSALGHSWQQITGQEATCLQNGTSAHWQCVRCNLCFDSNDDNYATNGKSHDDYTLLATGHNFKHVTNQAATCAAKGTVAHWECNKCNLCFDSNDDINATNGKAHDEYSIATAEHTLSIAAWRLYEGETELSAGSEIKSLSDVSATADIVCTACGYKEDGVRVICIQSALTEAHCNQVGSVTFKVKLTNHLNEAGTTTRDQTDIYSDDSQTFAIAMTSHVFNDYGLCNACGEVDSSRVFMDIGWLIVIIVAEEVALVALAIFAFIKKPKK